MVAQADLATPIGLCARLPLALGFGFGFAMMARRSELVAVRLIDVTDLDEGLLVRI
ncbi:hypothetical protein [Frankia sp. AgW1.1]|nr:hypothetical protein [Frankia sp. AgW1.1]MBL7488078.1 hypothetical protein [Frankia sp. AgW1.1]